MSERALLVHIQTYYFWVKNFILFALLFFFSNSVFAGTGVTYHGRIIKPDGNPLTATSVQFKMQIRSNGAEDCLLYEETQTKNMSSSDGAFNITMNDGTGTRTDTTGYSIESIFSNASAFSLPTQCAVGTSWTPSSTAGRKMVVSFKDTTMASFEAMPTQALNYVPQAIEAQQVGGLTPANLLQVKNSGSVQLTQSNLEAAFTGTAYTNLQAVLAGNMAVGTTGTASAPAIYFSGDSDTGFYSSGANQIGISTSGAQIFNISSSGMVSATTGGASVSTANGTASAPTFSFAGDTDTGWFRPAADTLAASTSGVERVRIDASGNLGVGTNSALGTLHTLGTGAIYMDRQTTGAHLLLRSSRGTVGAPTAQTVDQALGRISFMGYDGSGYVSTNNTGIAGVAAETWSGTNQGSYLTFSTTPLASTTAQERVRIDATGNVGIGTTTPGAKLEVNGDLRLTGSTSGYVGIKSPASVTTPVTWTLPNGDGSAGQVLSTDGSGILSWISAGSATGVSASAGSAGAPSIAFSGDSDTGWWHPAADTLAASTAGSERVRISSTGALGIGTTAPTSALQISNQGLQEGVAGGTTGLIYQTQTANARSALHIVPNGSSVGSDIWLFNSSDTVTNYGRLVIGHDWSGYWHLSTDKAGTGVVRPMFFDATGSGSPTTANLFLSTSGQVGVGVTTPASKLDVNGDIRLRGSTSGYVGIKSPASVTTPVTWTLPNGDGSAGQMLVTSGTGDLSWTTPGTVTTSTLGVGTSAAPSLTFSGDTDTGLYNVGANQIGISTSGVQRFIIDASGLVSPTTGGGSVSTANGTAASPTFSFAGDTDTGWFRPAADTMAAATAGSEKMRIDPSGYVGIGTTTPSSNLHVKGPSATSSNVTVETTSTAQYTGASIFLKGAASTANQAGTTISSFINDAGGTQGSFSISQTSNAGAWVNTIAQYNYNSQDWHFYTSGTDRLMINASGYVGIGTTNPSTNLHVAGSVWTYIRADGTNGGVFSMATNGTEKWEMYNSAGGDLRFYESNSVNQDRMTIKAGGNVGIGTTSPAAKLDVNGDIRLNGSTSGYVAIQAPATVTTPVTWTLPNGDGSSGQMLSTNGSGTLSWISPGTVTTSTVGSGSVGSPSMTFSGDTDTGFYNVGANQIGVSASGANIFTLSASGMVAATTGGGVVTTAAGSESAPTFSFAGDTDTGWFRPAADTLAAATSGSERVRINSAGNMGIGTTNPSYRMHIVGNYGAGTSVGLAIESSNTNGYSGGLSYILNPSGGGGPYSAALISAENSNNAGATDGGRLKFFTALQDGSHTLTERMRIDNSGFVGIGTTSPNQTLLLDRATGNNLLGFNTNGTTRAYVGVSNDVDNPIVGMTVGDLGLRVNGNDLFISTDSGSTPNVVVKNGGNVGIGTSSPNLGGSSGNFRELTLVGPVGGILEIGNTANTASAGSQVGTIDFYNGTTAITEIHTETMGTDSGDLMFYTRPASGSLTERLRIRSTGNIGIGTATPGAKLDVNGDIRLRGSTSGYVGIQAPTSVTTPVTWTLPNGDGSAGQMLVTSGSGVLSWTTPGTVTTSTVGAGSVGSPSMTFSGDTNTGLYNPAADTIGIVTGGSERVRVDASGYVGIGTTSPLQALDVNGVLKANYAELGASGAYQGFNIYYNGGWKYRATDYGYIIRHDGADLGFYSVASGTAGAAATPTYAMGISGTGYVGIGTTAPAYILDIQKATDPTIRVKATTSGSAWLIMEPTATGDAVIHNTSAAQSTVFTTNSTERMRINASGNVGIGTASPSYKLQVDGDSSSNILAWSVSGTGKAFIGTGSMFGSATGGTDMQFRSDAGHMVFGFSGTESMRISNTGNVGIGTTAPASALAIGSQSSHLSFMNPTDATGAGSKLQWLASDNSVTAAIQANRTAASNAPTDLTFTTRNASSSITEKLRITGSGYIGIGTSSPSVKLHVLDGNIKFDYTALGTVELNPSDGSAEIYRAGGNPFIDFKDSGGDDYDIRIQQFGSNGLMIGAGTGGSRMVIDNSGNVGIGTTAPSQKLEVSGGGIGVHASTGGEGLVAYGRSSDNFVWAPLALNNAGSAYLGGMNYTATGVALNVGSSLTVSTTWLANGNVGIGTSTPGELLEVAGNVKATSFISTSDARLKKDIETVDGLDLITRLRGVKFNWIKDGKPEYGTIAQEVEEVAPDLVVTDKNTGYKAVKYQGIIAPLIEAVKDLYAKWLDDHHRIDELKQENAELKARIERIERSLANEPQKPNAKIGDSK